jgi:hypothetical protein
MFPLIVRYGLFAGIVVAILMIVQMWALETGAMESGSLFLGYLTMVLALTAVFLGVKRYRDKDLGGVIRFGKAFLVGLGISCMACLIYVIGWELWLAFGSSDFVAVYSKKMLDAARAKDPSPEAIARATEEIDMFVRIYANPALRMGMTFMEMFPVGLLVSLITAAMLKNSRFLPARAPA